MLTDILSKNLFQHMLWCFNPVCLILPKNGKIVLKELFMPVVSSLMDLLAKPLLYTKFGVASIFVLLVFSAGFILCRIRKFVRRGAVFQGEIGKVSLRTCSSASIAGFNTTISGI